MLGNRFQERFFLLRGRCLLLLKEKKVRHGGEQEREAGRPGGRSRDCTYPLTPQPTLIESFLPWPFDL